MQPPHHRPGYQPRRYSSVQRTELYQNVEDPTMLIQAIPGGLSSAEETYRDLTPVQREAERAADSADAGASARRGGLVRAGAGMAVATVVSRVTGLLVKIAIGAIFATGIVSDSYTLANTLPNIVFELLIGGVLTSVAIPLLTRAQRNDEDGGAEYTQRLMTMAVVGLAVATVLAVLAAPFLTKLYLSSGSLADAGMATNFARLLLPQIFFYGVAALFGAILNSRERFAANAWAPVVNNVVVIAVAGVLTVSHFGNRSAKDISATNLLILGVGTTLGIVAQAAVMIPSLRKAGFRWKWRWGLDPRFREAGRLIGWATIYVLVSQVGVVVTQRVASQKLSGGITQFQYASLIFQMPYGILGVAVLTVIMPRMSRHAAENDLDAMKGDASLANRLSTVALLPITAGLFVLGEAAAVLLFNHGQLINSQARAIGVGVAFFAFGLVPLSVTLVQMRVFYAMKDGRTPTLINLIMVIVRVPLMLFCLTLDTDHVVPGLAIATVLSYVVGAVVGEFWLRARFGDMRTRRLLVTFAKMAVASAVGAAVAWFVVKSTVGLHPSGSMRALLTLLVGAVVGGAVIGALMVALRVAEIAPVQRRVLGKLGIRTAAAAADRPVASPKSPPPDVPDAAGLPAEVVAARRRPPGARRPGTPPGMGGSTGGLGPPGSVSGAARARPVPPAAAGGPIPTTPPKMPHFDVPVPDLSEQVTKLVTSPSDGPTATGTGRPANPDGPTSAVTTSALLGNAGNDPTVNIGARPGQPTDGPTGNIPTGNIPTGTVPTGTVPTSGRPIQGRHDDPTVNVGGLVKKPAGPAASLAPGATVGGRYRLVSLITSDSAGNRFWRAKDNVLPRDMAVTLLPEGPQTAATVARTLRVGRLNHIGLPQTLDVGTEQGQEYVVGQWVDGATLTDLLSSGPLEPDVATSITAKIAEAIAEAHRNGIALGAINPSLVRVNFDGQVRLSHLIAHANATPEQDIRAVGALLYMMLTGTWPLPTPTRATRDATRTGSGSVDLAGMIGTDLGLPAAPSRLGREVPAREVRSTVPEALSALADHALHPDEPAGIHAVGAIASLLRRPEAGTAVAAPDPVADAPTAAVSLSPSERRLVKERRVKLGIATVVLAVFLTLIIILVASLSKQFLTNVAGSGNISGSSDVSMLPTGASSVPTTSQSTVRSSSSAGGAPATSASKTRTSTGTSTSSSTTASSTTSSSSVAPGVPVNITAATVWDPKGTPPTDNTGQVGRIFDKDKTTAWSTFDYNQQFPTLKPGVGVMIQLEKATTLTSIEVDTDLVPATVEIRSATGPNATYESTTVLATATLKSASTTITIKNAPSSTYFAIFFTKLATSPTNASRFKADITEVTVNGR